MVETDRVSPCTRTRLLPRYAARTGPDDNGDAVSDDDTRRPVRWKEWRSSNSTSVLYESLVIDIVAQTVMSVI